MGSVMDLHSGRHASAPHGFSLEKGASFDEHSLDPCGLLGATQTYSLNLSVFSMY